MVERPIELKEIDGVSLIGFRINPDSESPDVYTLMTYGAKEMPIVVNGQLLFFRSPTSTAVVYEFFEESIKKLASLPTETDAICDVAAMLHIINHQDSDESATVLNCLNTLFDLVNATQLTIPTAYKKMLYNLADHLTFNQDFADYINQQGLERANITNGVLWCIGAIVVNSRILVEQS